MVRPSQNGARGGHTIKNAVDTELLQINTTLLVDHGIAVETGGDLLRFVAFGSKSPSELDRELIEWHVIIKRIDHANSKTSKSNVARQWSNRCYQRSEPDPATNAPSALRSACCSGGDSLAYAKPSQGFAGRFGQKGIPQRLLIGNQIKYSDTRRMSFSSDAGSDIVRPAAVSFSLMKWSITSHSPVSFTWGRTVPKTPKPH